MSWLGVRDSNHLARGPCSPSVFPVGESTDGRELRSDVANRERRSANIGAVPTPVGRPYNRPGVFQVNSAETIERVPIHTDADGVVRVAGTRVTLDTIVAAFDAGATARRSPSSTRRSPSPTFTP